MYTILINDDNSFSVTEKQRIVQRSKMVDTFRFLMKPIYNGFDMSGCTFYIEYLRPASKKYEMEFLTLSDEMYNEHLQYTLPVDTCFTEEAGTLEIQCSMTYVNIDADGNTVQRVRKIAPALKVEVIPISAWSDIIPDNALSALDQRIIKVDAQIKAIEDMSEIMVNSKADNLAYDSDTNELQLTAGGMPIGEKVALNTYEDSMEDGVPVTDFTITYPDDGGDDSEEESDVVEF